MLWAIFFNRLGRAASSAALKTSVWNTVYLERAVASLSVPGKEIGTDLLAHLSPLG